MVQIQKHTPNQLVLSDVPSKKTTQLDTRQLVIAAQREATQLAQFESNFSETTENKATSLPSIPGYQIVKQLHRGAQGTVYWAYRTDNDSPHEADSPLAIKVLSSDSIPSETGRLRFEREIELLQRLNDPRIVPVIDQGEVAGQHYFVMPLIEGEPLDKSIESGALSLEQRVELAIEIAEAVESAHRIGIIHRDLKPSNILIDSRGEVNLIDFGLATQNSSNQDDAGQLNNDSLNETLTIAGQFIGSLPWSSPEHASCDPTRIDVRSDVYSLGVILYQLITGVLPYTLEGGPLALLDRIKNESPDRPGSLDPRIPKDLETIVLKCLHKQPERRYQSAGQLKDDLNRWIAGAPIAARRDSPTYVISQTIKKHKIASGLVLAFWMGGLLLGFGMTTLYQRATQQISQKEAENKRLKDQLDQLQKKIVQPKSWMTAIQSADELREMSPEDGWEFIQTTWARLETVHAKQQFLKSIAFSRHPATHRGLNLGMQDSEPKVQAWASQYLSSIALFEVAESIDRYQKWHAANQNLELEQVLSRSVERIAGEIAHARKRQNKQELQAQLTHLSHASVLRKAESKAVSNAVARSGIATALMEIANDQSLGKDLVALQKASMAALQVLPLSEAFIKEKIVSLLSSGSEYQVAAAASVIGRLKPQTGWATNALLDSLTTSASNKNQLACWNIASALASQGDPRAIPKMIEVIEADNTYNTIYGVGYFGLGKMTGVKYDKSHNGAWWRNWWQQNHHRYQLDDSDTQISAIVSEQSSNSIQTDAVALADVAVSENVQTIRPGEILQANNDKMAQYILYEGGKSTDKPLAARNNLLLILPGGAGGIDFKGFCQSIAKYTTDETFLVAQLVAPTWNKKQAQKLVWPTRKNKYREVRFATEDHAKLVIDDIKKRYEVATTHIYTMSWSSGGPAAYAISLAKDLPITGSFIAMSIYHPNQLPPRKSAKGRIYYLFHSPQDFIKMRFPKLAKKELEAAGARVKLQTYQGGHGWHGDVMSNIRRAINWMQENTPDDNNE